VVKELAATTAAAAAAAARAAVVSTQAAVDALDPLSHSLVFAEAASRVAVAQAAHADDALRVATANNPATVHSVSGSTPKRSSVADMMNAGLDVDSDSEPEESLAEIARRQALTPDESGSAADLLRAAKMNRDIEDAKKEVAAYFVTVMSSREKKLPVAQWCAHCVSTAMP
jgi:hypothetical protein